MVKRPIMTINYLISNTYGSSTLRVPTLTGTEDLTRIDWFY
jgi:hypothetical protein